MAFVEVYVITPDGERYRAEVDEHADAGTLLQDLISELRLPATQEGKPIDYAIKLVDATGIHRGVTIEIAIAKPPKSARIIRKE